MSLSSRCQLRQRIFFSIINLKQTTMKKIFAFAVMALVCAACTNPNGSPEDGLVTKNEMQMKKVKITFSPYDIHEMTRATLPIGDVVSKLDVWLYEGTPATAVAQAKPVAEKHQTVGDDDFGKLSLTLNKDKTYTLYAIGHKQSAATTLADGVVSFPDEKITQTFYYSTTFTPSKTSKLDCVMQRCIGMFRIVIVDEIPADVKQFSVSANNTPTKWSFLQLSGIAPRSDTYTVRWENFKHETDGTTSFSIYILGSDVEQKYNITVSAYDADGNVAKQRTFTDVPIRNNYISLYRGSFFLDTPFSSAFTVNDDWSSYDTVEF